jgi:hypothetical protein
MVTVRQAAIQLAILLLLGAALISCKEVAATGKQTTAEERRARKAAVIKKIASLGYVDRAPAADPEKRRVTLAVEEKTSDILTLYAARNRAEARLLDRSGRVVRRWSARQRKPNWMHVELLPDGDLLVISKLQYLARYSWDSSLRWKRRASAHHDLDVGPDGDLWVLGTAIRRYRHDGVNIPILDNAVLRYSGDGKPRSRRFLYPLLWQLVPRQRLDAIARRQRERPHTLKELFKENVNTDVLHTNSIQVLRRAIEGVCEAGSILLSVRELNAVVILDPDLKRVLWSWGPGELQEQHHATLLKNGSIMIFDNGIHRKQSRVVEVDPRTRKIGWSYSAPGFFTRVRGAAQKLPNGNVLITESDRGHVFEVSRGGKVVWEFYNPDVVGQENPTRAVIYRMAGYPRGYLEDGLLD